MTASRTELPVLPSRISRLQVTRKAKHKMASGKWRKRDASM
jgi:hypothetical protein